MIVAWNGIPAAPTRSASSPRRPPRNRMLTPLSISRSASATASNGLTCPAVPPPTSSTRQARGLCPREPPRGRCPPNSPGAGGRCPPSLTNVQEDTDGDESDAERGAAVRDERERDPGHRREACDDRHVHP